MSRVTTGRKVRCQTDGCPLQGMIWTLRPEPGPGESAGLHVWPDVRCNGCGCQPNFIGYEEGEKPK